MMYLLLLFFFIFKCLYYLLIAAAVAGYVMGAALGILLLGSALFDAIKKLTCMLYDTSLEIIQDIKYGFDEIADFFDGSFNNQTAKNIALALSSPLIFLAVILATLGIIVKNTLPTLLSVVANLANKLLLTLVLPFACAITAVTLLFYPKLLPISQLISIFSIANCNIHPTDRPPISNNFRVNLAPRRSSNISKIVQANKTLAAQIRLLRANNFNPNHLKMHTDMINEINALPDDNRRKIALNELNKTLAENGCIICGEELDNIDAITLEFRDNRNHLHTYIYDRRSLIEWITTCSSNNRYAHDPISRLALAHSNKSWKFEGPERNGITFKKDGQIYKIYRGVPTGLKNKLEELADMCHQTGLGSHPNSIFNHTEVHPSQANSARAAPKPINHIAA